MKTFNSSKFKSFAKALLGKKDLPLPEIKMLSKPFLYCIDSPQPKDAISAAFVIVSGWIVGGESSQIKDVILCNETDDVFPLSLVDRPDVESAYPHRTAVGFQEFILTRQLTLGTSWFIQFWMDEEVYRFPLDLFVSGELCEEFLQQKQAKLAQIRPILQCPVCESDRLLIQDPVLSCPDCGSEFQLNSNHYNFLNRQLTEYGNVKSTASISANDYDPISLQLIEQLTNGLILDNGCGLRNFYYPNVVNLDIVDYPTTDVISIGEKLPFKSNSFDAVFSLAVLEHVKNPFECAKEIMRVLKPGGTLYAVVPFLQPFHGYPDHYYNMTSSGLKNLFSELEDLDCTVQLPGLPIAALTWFLNSYVQGLPQPIAESFKEMKIGDLLAHPHSYMDRDFVTSLQPQTNEELASCNYLIAKKPL
ncbi:methylase involved in ubiquinone/menaquinone biosynthesis [Oscillatoria acuminata PCC 6304]|uniref:Methylase involved in ubiquinone/menaquinone biosynthesis n=2 Tax=Oscillatoria acuminata TaxID=118323 RepID=K9TP72_9CYAN|nr:methylase involved in ubiquinone/menaquinone biosynthesis [Oscillatoria acuminata PCC 6304]